MMWIQFALGNCVCTVSSRRAEIDCYYFGWCNLYVCNSIFNFAKAVTTITSFKAGNQEHFFDVHASSPDFFRDSAALTKQHIMAAT